MSSLKIISDWKKNKKNWSLSQESIPDTKEKLDNKPLTNGIENYDIEQYDQLITFYGMCEVDKSEETLESRHNWLVEIESNIEDDLPETIKNAAFQKNLRFWAISHNIFHLAIKGLLTTIKINKYFYYIVPQDPQTLLRTFHQTVFLTKVGKGNYWHQGLELSLQHVLDGLPNLPPTLSLNINIGGLPIYKSSKS